MRRFIIIEVIFLLLIISAMVADLRADNYYGSNFNCPEPVDPGFDMVIEAPEKVFIGDKFDYKATITWDEDIDNVLASLKDDNAHFEVLEWKQRLWKSDIGERLEVTAKIRAKNVGTAAFIPFSITYHKDGRKQYTRASTHIIKCERLVVWKTEMDVDKISFGIPVTYSLEATARKGRIVFGWGDISSIQGINNPPVVEEIETGTGITYKFNRRFFFEEAGEYEFAPIVMKHFIDGELHETYTPRAGELKVVPIETDIVLDKGVIQLGDIFHFGYSLTLPEGWKAIERWSDFDFSPFEVVKTTYSPTFIKVSLRLFKKPDIYELGPFPVHYEDPDGNADKFYIPPIAIRVNSILPEYGAVFKPFTDPIRNEHKFYIDFLNFYLPISVGGIFITSVFGLLVFLLLRRSKQKVEREPLDELLDFLDAWSPTLATLSSYCDRIKSFLIAKPETKSTADILANIEPRITESVREILAEGDKQRYSLREPDMEKVQKARRHLMRMLTDELSSTD